MAIIISATNFEKEVMQSKIPVLVDFWAEWCGPCRMLTPVIDELARDYEGKVKICKLNVDELSDVASRFGVMSIPTVIVFKEGKAVNQVVGAVPKEKLAGMIDDLLTA
ncbi:MAG: thioredoxin [Candidatus Omnitrophica bacterium]|nr:thioredoxin [Candidatus Omnitrophota bacterium]MBU4479295.1 thioredoxin [Candidatus Omnitrophota bacterium]MCG2703276.1 thioredoxin [Candidatus Omnitrophota bacterium]